MADVPTVEVLGPLGPFAAGFVDDMWRRGFGPVAVRKHMGLVAGLSGWLATEDLALSGLSSEVAERFCAARREAGHTYQRYFSFCRARCRPFSCAPLTIR